MSTGDPAPTYHPAGSAPAADAGSGSITKLIAGILDDSSSLIKQQLQMVQAEVKGEVQRVTAAGKFLGVGTFLALVGVFFILMGVPPLLQELTGWPAWACWMTFGTVVFLVGLVALLVGRSQLAKFNPVPEKSLSALSSNVSALTGSTPTK